MADAAQAISNQVPETALKIYATGWVATIIASLPGPDGWAHVHCSTVGSTKDLALEAAQYVLDVWAKGRIAFIRVKPEAVSEEDFNTKVIGHAGCTRFSYKLEPGDWIYTDHKTIPYLFGEQH